MSKLILRSNNTNVNYVVETKSIDTTIGESIKDPAEVFITPKPGYNISANDFINGVLPNPISNITYRNAGNSVIARVEFNDQPVAIEVINLYLPISGNLKRSDNTLTITDITARDENVLETTSSVGVTQSADVYKGSSVYKITTQSSGSIKVLSKTFSAPNSFYFEKDPTYSISGNNSRYKVSINVTKDNVGRTVKKSFDVFYNFPDQNPVIEPQNTITFEARSKAVEVDRKKVVAEIEKDYKIYNVDYGKNLGLEGGLKHIKVNGVPGTKFKVLVQDSDNKVYDFKSGGFKTGASFLEGIIPQAKTGVGYGTFDAFLNVEASTTAKTISTKIVTVAPTKGESEGSVSTTTVIPDSIDESVDVEVTLTLEVVKDSVAYVVKRPALKSEQDTLTDDQITNGVTDGTYAVTAITGASINGDNNPVEYYEGNSTIYTWNITCADNKALGINRQPRFVYNQEYVNWDSAHSGESAPITKEKNNAGSDILTDVDNISTLNSWTFDGIEISITPPEDSDIIEASDFVGGFDVVYSKLLLSIQVEDTYAGTANINPEINLDNFLTLVATS